MLVLSRASSAKSARAGLIAAVHARARDLGIDNETRAALQRRVTGKASCGGMTDDELRRVLREMASHGMGGTPAGTPADAVAGAPTSARRHSGRDMLATGTPAARAMTAKLRALWLSAYWLGVTRDYTDAALISFVKRQTRLDAARFAGAAQDAARAIEGIKAWLARPAETGGAGVNWSPCAGTDGVHHRETRNPAARVLEAQWRILHRMGEINSADTGALSAWVNCVRGIPGDYADLEYGEINRLIRDLGRRLRKAKGEEGTSDAG